jgi:hypothetical protein
MGDAVVRLARVAALAALAATSSCVTAEYEREIVFSRVSERGIAQLIPGEHDLGHCLERLGAPNFVWERRGDAIALAYAGYRDAGWGLGASVQVARGVSASFDYGELAGRSKGFVLLFDEQWRLEGVRSGYLRDLRGPIQRPMPQAME